MNTNDLSTIYLDDKYQMFIFLKDNYCRNKNDKLLPFIMNLLPFSKEKENLIISEIGNETLIGLLSKNFLKLKPNYCEYIQQILDNLLILFTSPTIQFVGFHDYGSTKEWFENKFTKWLFCRNNDNDFFFSANNSQISIKKIELLFSKTTEKDFGNIINNLERIKIKKEIISLFIIWFAINLFSKKGVYYNKASRLLLTYKDKLDPKHISTPVFMYYYLRLINKSSLEKKYGLFKFISSYFDEYQNKFKPIYEAMLDILLAIKKNYDKLYTLVEGKVSKDRLIEIFPITLEDYFDDKIRNFLNDKNAIYRTNELVTYYKMIKRNQCKFMDFYESNISFLKEKCLEVNKKLVNIGYYDEIFTYEFHKTVIIPLEKEIIPKAIQADIIKNSEEILKLKKEYAIKNAHKFPMIKKDQTIDDYSENLEQMIYIEKDENKKMEMLSKITLIKEEFLKQYLALTRIIEKNEEVYICDFSAKKIRDLIMNQIDSFITKINSEHSFPKTNSESTILALINDNQMRETITNHLVTAQLIYNSLIKNNENTYKAEFSSVILPMTKSIELILSAVLPLERILKEESINSMNDCIPVSIKNHYFDNHGRPKKEFELGDFAYALSSKTIAKTNLKYNSFFKIDKYLMKDRIKFIFENPITISLSNGQSFYFKDVSNSIELNQISQIIDYIRLHYRNLACHKNEALEEQAVQCKKLLTETQQFLSFLIFIFKW